MRAPVMQTVLTIVILFVVWQSPAQCPKNADDIVNGFTIKSGSTCNVNIPKGVEITGKVTVEERAELNITGEYIDISSGVLNINGILNIDTETTTWVHNGGTIHVGKTGIVDFGSGDLEVYAHSALNVAGIIINVDDLWNLSGSKIKVNKGGILNVTDFHNFEGSSLIDGIVNSSGVFRTHEALLNGNGYINGKFINNSWKELKGAFANCETGLNCGNSNLLPKAIQRDLDTKNDSGHITSGTKQRHVISYPFEDYDLNNEDYKNVASHNSNVSFASTIEQGNQSIRVTSNSRDGKIVISGSENDTFDVSAYNSIGENVLHFKGINLRMAQNNINEILSTLENDRYSLSFTNSEVEYTIPLILN